MAGYNGTRTGSAVFPRMRMHMHRVLKKIPGQGGKQFQHELKSSYHLLPVTALYRG